MLVVEPVDEKEWVIDQMEPAISNEEEKSLPGPRIPLDSPADQSPYILDCWLWIEVRNYLSWLNWVISFLPKVGFTVLL